MPREIRDAAGDSGEFYTPGAAVRFMVAVTDPRLGEAAPDPASGTGRPLVEAFNHLSKQVKTLASRRVLQTRKSLRLRRNRPMKLSVKRSLDMLRGDVEALKRLRAETVAELEALLPTFRDCNLEGEQ